ncbi:MAG: methyltransferase domain-containing protein [Chitinophagaceae bacterium]|nr:MAG: methyltransferase domain-containing protein [Chitinophagaceae bacterium]
MNQSPYIIAGGASGKERLARLGGIMNAGTLALLRTLQPESVARFLDLGCGGGSLSMAVAKSGLAGQVTGIDFDAALLELARQDAAAAGIVNLVFEPGDATQPLAAGGFDTSYARFLLCHMTDPLLVLRHLAAALRPGGLILVEDVDFSGHYCYPPNAAFARYLDYYTRAARQNGQDPDIGLRLLALFREAGITEVGFDVVQPSFHTGSGKWMAYDTLHRIGAAVERQGIATAGELQATLGELKAFTEDESTIISMPRIFRVWGRRQ